MTDIDKAKAVLAVCANFGIALSGSDRVQIANSLRAMIAKAEQADEFEAFKRDVSDAVEDYCGYVPPDCPSHPITRFILPKPVDPLVEALNEALLSEQDMGAQEMADNFRAALAKRGLQISEVQS